ncbi:hypothetical protein [Streptomyces sp. NPDC005141]
MRGLRDGVLLRVHERAGLADDLADGDRVDGQQIYQDLLGTNAAQVDHGDEDAVGVREQGSAVCSGGLQAPAAALLELALFRLGGLRGG